MNPQLTAPNEGLCDQLDYVLSAPISGVLSWLLMLWVNDDLVVTQQTVYADLIEATFMGYVRRTLDRSSWTAATLEGDYAVATWSTEPIVWINSGPPATVYGWAIITPLSPVIRYIQPLPAPVTVNSGDPIAVLPRVAMTTLPPPVGFRSRRRPSWFGGKPKRR
jgi:hypothetical protein